MTIFQKMILVPSLSLLMYFGFIAYSYFEHNLSTAKIDQLRESYVPASELINHNIFLFEKIQTTFKDAVLAKERSWLKDTISTQKKFNKNLSLLSHYPAIVDPQSIKHIGDNFNQYFADAYELASHLLAKQPKWHGNEEIIRRIEASQNATQQVLMENRHNIQQGLLTAIDKTHSLKDSVLFWGLAISATSMILLIVVTIFISYSFRLDMFDIVQRTKKLANGCTDFGQRIERKNKDELGDLVHWFNKLYDKLEADYLTLKEISITDKLTQLNNRNRTDQYLPQALAKAKESQQCMLVVVIDIDHFKNVNDKYGHLVGDEVLQLFANELKSRAETGDFISRWGGEEFLLIWSNTHAIYAKQKADTMREAIAAIKHPVAGSVTASFGIAIAKPDDNVQSIVNRADNNLYQAKQHGRNIVVIDNIC
ncbi:diguanylate cyclase domain-containing protein [Thalassotalea sp. PLHSN55]|uniref:diguanylate cyclase domain-containing protein n=1 Tax=Thalassotalea sp. PLHSN55 TaxID=3435888 RepID=UPI003F84EDEE